MFQGFVTSTTALLASAFASTTGVLTGLVGGAAANASTIITQPLISERPVGPVGDSGRANGHSPLHRDDVFIPARRGEVTSPLHLGQRMAPALGLPLFAPLSVVLWSGVVGKMWRNITQGPSEKIHDLSRSISAEDLEGDTPPRALTKLLSFLKGSDLQLRYVAAEAILHLPWEGDNPHLSVAERAAAGLPWEGGNPHLLSPDEWLMVASPFYDGLSREHITYPDANRGPSSLAPSNRLLRLLTILFEGNHADARTILHSVIHAGLPYAAVPGRVLLDRILARQEKTPTLQRLYVEILQVASFGPGIVDTQHTVRSDMDAWKQKIFLTGPRGVDTFLRWHTFRYLVFRERDTVTEKLGLLAAINRLPDRSFHSTTLYDFLHRNRVNSQTTGGEDPLLELVRLASLDWIASITTAGATPPPKDEADGLVRLLTTSNDVRRFFETLPPSTYRGTLNGSWEILKALLTRDDLAYRETDHAYKEICLLNAAISVARRITEDAERREAEEFLFEKISGFFERRYSTLSTAQILAVWVPAVIFFRDDPVRLNWLHGPEFILGAEAQLREGAAPSLVRALAILARHEDSEAFAVSGRPKSAQVILTESDETYDIFALVADSFEEVENVRRHAELLEDRTTVDMGGEHVVVGSASDYARTERE